MCNYTHIYEVDDTFEKANSFAINNVRHHSFHDFGDADWVKFYAVSGQIYKIRTTNLSSACDTVIQMYHRIGQDRTFL